MPGRALVLLIIRQPVSSWTVLGRGRSCHSLASRFRLRPFRKHPTKWHCVSKPIDVWYSHFKELQSAMLASGGE
ncbi:hypothetical protein CCACVL1_05483 [Corchorus capsularis]|uniref:Secreted protein n=1 Tax=Corchorus capsularis TaxID=210143 RepID=A0A1R3JKC9_COCAP|nr:hypothetical protein CCACVL1_05483 [Corchorus capsularis]